MQTDRSTQHSFHLVLMLMLTIHGASLRGELPWLAKIRDDIIEILKLSCYLFRAEMQHCSNWNKI
jgi:hypothetical protein